MNSTALLALVSVTIFLVGCQNNSDNLKETEKYPPCGSSEWRIHKFIGEEWVAGNEGHNYRLNESETQEKLKSITKGLQEIRCWNVTGWVNETRCYGNDWCYEYHVKRIR